MAVVHICHLSEKRSTIAVWSVRIKVFRFPRAQVRHEIVAVRQPQFLLPSNNLRSPPKLNKSSRREVSWRSLVVLVKMLQAALVEKTYVGIVPKLKSSGAKTRKTAER
jgi:hypothetical protein